MQKGKLNQKIERIVNQTAFNREKARGVYSKKLLQKTLKLLPINPKNDFLE